MKGIYTGEIYNTKNQNINNFIDSIKQQSESFRTFLIKFAMEDFNNKIKSTKNKDKFRKAFIDYFKTKFPHISIDKNFKELKQNKLYQLTNNQIIEIIDDILPATIGDMTLLPKKTDKHLSQYKKYDRNKLIKTLKEEPNNKGDIIYDDLTTEQLLELYKKITGKEYIGSGILRPTEKQIHKKYFIDTNKLNNNVLEIRYNKNRHLTNVKTQVIGNGVKNIIHDITNNDNMNEKDYHVLTEHEKHLIRTILNMLEKSHLLGSADEQFNSKFQILLGEYNAGNNSEVLRNQLKQYIIHAMKLGIIPRNTGNAMLLEMSL